MIMFKIGDRVVLTEVYSGLPIGTKGTVIETRNTPLIQVCFDNEPRHQHCAIYDCRLSKVTKEKEHMTKFKVGDKVRLVRNNACSSHKVGDVGYVVEGGTGPAGNLLVEVNGYSLRGETWSYPSDLELVTDDVAQLDIPSWVESLTKEQKRNLLRTVEESLATERVTLYSVAGRKWGKKRYPETKLKMTYTLVNGVIKGQPKVENV